MCIVIRSVGKAMPRAGAYLYEIIAVKGYGHLHQYWTDITICRFPPQMSMKCDRGFMGPSYGYFVPALDGFVEKRYNPFFLILACMAFECRRVARCSFRTVISRVDVMFCFCNVARSGRAALPD